MGCVDCACWPLLDAHPRENFDRGRLMSMPTANHEMPPVGVLRADVTRDLHAAEVRPLILEPVLGKSALERSVELLARLGCVDIHIMLGDEAYSIRQHLQTGERWGCTFRYHYMSALYSVTELMDVIQSTTDRRYWLADARCVPMTDVSSLHVDSDICIAYGNHESPPVFSGWAAVSGTLLAKCSDWSVFQAGGSTVDYSGIKIVKCRGVLRCFSVADLHASTQFMLAGLAQQCIVKRSCQIHSSAKLISPVWIGEQVKIGRGCVIGPNVSIESMCVVDEGTTVVRSCIGDKTYLGRGLELNDSSVMQGYLFRPSLAVSLKIEDEVLLTGLAVTRESIWWLVMLSCLLRTVCWPLYVMMQVGWIKTTHSYRRQHFCTIFFPGLLGIIRNGDRLVGHCAPPTPLDTADNDVNHLPNDAIQTAPRGLLNDAVVIGVSPNQDPDFWMASNLYAATKGDNISFNIKLVCQYLARVTVDCLTPITSKLNLHHSRDS